MVVLKTITVAFQTKVNRSIFIAMRSGLFHTLNTACHLGRSVPASFFLTRCGQCLISSKRTSSSEAALFGILLRCSVLSLDKRFFGLPTGLSDGLSLKIRTFAILLVNSASFICRQTGTFNLIAYLLYKSYALTLQISSK